MSKRFFIIKVDYRWLILIVPVALSCVMFYIGNDVANIVSFAIGVILALVANWDILKIVVNIIFGKEKKHE